MKNLVFIISLIAFHSAYAQGGHVYTVAGNSTYGFSGDGGLATIASLNATEGVWLDAAGNVFFSDMDNERVRKITASTGIITTIAGTGSSGFLGDGGPGTAAQVSSPYGLYADASGNCYFTDRGNSRIRRVDAISGIITTIAGGGSTLGDAGQATLAQINSPQNVYLDGIGNIYIAASSRIRKVDAATGIISTIAGTGSSGYSGDGGPATLAQINAWAAGMVIDMYGNLLFSDRGNHAIRKIDATSHIITTIAGTGSSGYSGDGGPATLAKINGPIGLDLDPAGNIIISDNQNNYIRKVDIGTGIITTIAGVGSWADLTSEGLPALSADIHQEFICVNSIGTIYYSNYGRHICRIIFNSNHPPFFTGGHRQYLKSCPSSTGTVIDTFLRIDDSDIGQHETWSLATAPMHGTALVAYSTTSTGGILIPSGLTYTPVSGYSGNDSFTVRITDGINTDTTKILVEIYPAPNAGSIAGIATVCAGSAVTVSDTALGGVWSMSNSNALLSGGIVTGVSEGTDTVGYTVSNSCGSANAQLVVTINPLPNAGIIIGSDTICVGNPATLVSSQVGGTWGCVDSLATISAGGVISNDTVGGVLEIKYVVSNSCGSDSTYFSVSVSRSTDCSALSIENNLQINNILTLFPNPATNELTIKTTNNTYTSFTITNMMGQQIMQQTINTNETSINIAALPVGVYFVTFKGEKEDVVRRFVKM